MYKCRSTCNTQGYWSTRQQTDTTECVSLSETRRLPCDLWTPGAMWATCQASEVIWISWNTEAALDQAWFRARAGVSLTFTNMSFLSLCLFQCFPSQSFILTHNTGRGRCRCRQLAFENSYWEVCFYKALLLLHISVISTGCHLFTRPQRQKCIQFTMRESWGIIFHTNFTSIGRYQMNQGHSAHTQATLWVSWQEQFASPAGYFSLPVSHGGANGFYFQDTMLLQSFGPIWRQRVKKGRVANATYDQHMGMS